MEISAPKYKIYEGIKMSCLSIGLTHAFEPTYVVMIAAVLATRHCNDPEFDVDRSDARAVLEALRGQVRLAAKRANLRHYGVIAHYPETPKEFLDKHPELFAKAYPRHTEWLRTAPRTAQWTNP